MHTTNLFFLFLFTSTLIFLTTTTFANHAPSLENDETPVDTSDARKPPQHGHKPPTHKPPHEPPHHGRHPPEVETESVKKPPHKPPPKRKPPHHGHPPTEVDTEAAHKPPRGGRPSHYGRPPKLDTKP
ncbi:hypothetical protein QVD17_28019 [Tagetes erecta]|uniref:Uncharacterized protein n=1 Tax=Tagetes erecta TaxID=13708 RepID=A0AAD8KD15_TARER|nr:hypothetical protein QVD17_28019 [Tagetes erecta]